MPLKKKWIRIMAEEGDLISRNRVPHCANVLSKHGLEDYAGLWKDISAAMDSARDIASKKIAKQEQADAQRMEKVRQGICKKLDKRSWGAVKRLSLAELELALLLFKSNEHMGAIDELIRGKRRKAEKNVDIGVEHVRIAFGRSNASLSKKLYAKLESIGSMGILASLCMRVQKASERAKDYRGKYKGLSYDRKSDGMESLVSHLTALSDISWGWGKDSQANYECVLYVELQDVGQVSWHSPVRLEGPDYQKEWDKKHESRERILQFAEQVLSRPRS